MEKREWGGKQRRVNKRQAWGAEARGSPVLLSVWATRGGSVTKWGRGGAEKERNKVRWAEKSTAKRPKLKSKYQQIHAYILVSNQVNISTLRNTESGLIYTVSGLG